MRLKEGLHTLRKRSFEDELKAFDEKISALQKHIVNLKHDNDEFSDVFINSYNELIKRFKHERDKIAQTIGRK